MNYGLVTFRSHPCDKNLDEQFLCFLQPTLKKLDKYILAYEKENTPDAHFHLLLPVSGDISHLRQKFTTKNFRVFWSLCENTHTNVGSPSSKTFGDQPGFNLKMVSKTEEDYMKTIGYVCKENPKYTKGYTETDITQGIKFYHASARQPEKIDDSWKILNIKTVIPWMEKTAESYGVPPYHKHIFYYMARNKMFVDLSNKSKDNVRASLEIAHMSLADDDYYTKDFLAAQLNGDSEDGVDMFTLKQENMKLRKLLKKHNIEINI